MLQVSGVGGSRVWAGGRGRSEMRFSMAASLGNGLHKLTRPPVSPSRTGAALPELRIGPPGMHLGRTIAGHRAHAACNWHASPSSPPPPHPTPHMLPAPHLPMAAMTVLKSLLRTFSRTYVSPAGAGQTSPDCFGSCLLCWACCTVGCHDTFLPPAPLAATGLPEGDQHVPRATHLPGPCCPGTPALWCRPCRWWR